MSETFGVVVGGKFPEVVYPPAHCRNDVDDDGNPAGGTVSGKGLEISWQNGPLGRDLEGNVGKPNGTYVETVLEACVERLRFYNTASNGKWACRENSIAITAIEEALGTLHRRMVRRERANVRGLNVQAPGDGR